jgi:[ribosomal protein S5]-alanine N-acetyltransferase
VAALISFGFEQLDLHRIEAFTLPFNGRAIGLLARLGFQNEGCLRQRYHVAGTVVDAAAFGLLRSEWNKPQ